MRNISGPVTFEGITGNKFADRNIPTYMNKYYLSAVNGEEELLDDIVRFMNFNMSIPIAYTFEE